jgi:O-6-methylguanine DNA methyltransferase
MNVTFTTLTSREFTQFLKKHPTTSCYFKTQAGILHVWSASGYIYKAEFITPEDEKNIPKGTVQTTLDSSKIFLVGTPFQCAVWQAAFNISAGTTIAYQSLADTMYKSRAVRAVANALANNKVAYFIPCHRVVGKGGDLCGYRWGIERKAALLQSEGAL